MDEAINAVAHRPEWLPLVEQYAATHSTKGFPSLEGEFGPGHWKVDSNRNRVTEDGLKRWYVYWREHTGRHHPIGAFSSVPVDRPQSEDGVGQITVGWDPEGRRLVRISVKGDEARFRVVAVKWEEVRGKLVPRPVPLQEQPMPDGQRPPKSDADWDALRQVVQTLVETGQFYARGDDRT